MEIQIFFIHFSYIQMIAEFNSYMSNIDIDFFKELCLKHGELRHYKKNEFILHEGDATGQKTSRIMSVFPFQMNL